MPDEKKERIASAVASLLQQYTAEVSSSDVLRSGAAGMIVEILREPTAPASEIERRLRREARRFRRIAAGALFQAAADSLKAEIDGRGRA